MSELTSTSPLGSSKTEQLERVAHAIIKLCAAQQRCQADVPETWISTREIAEYCNFSIYKTRYLLLKMVRQGWVQVTPHPIKNALRWHLCPENPPKKSLISL